MVKLYDYRMYELNLKQHKFNDGDYATAAQAVEVKLDLKKLEDPNFEILCVNSFTENLNYLTENWADFCNAGTTSTAMVGIDPEYSGEFIIKYNELTANVTKIRHDIQAVNNIPVQITNTLLDEQLDFKGSFSSFEVTMESNALIKASFSIKPTTAVKRTDVPVV